MGLTFVDLYKPFDTTYPTAITEALTSKGVDNPYVETFTGCKANNAKFNICDHIPVSLRTYFDKKKLGFVFRYSLFKPKTIFTHCLHGNRFIL